jgi:hypothetical protein
MTCILVVERTRSRFPRMIGDNKTGYADRTLRDGNPVIRGLARSQAREQRRLPRYPDGSRRKRRTRHPS